MVQYGTDVPRHVSVVNNVHKLLCVMQFATLMLEVVMRQNFYLPWAQNYQEIRTGHCAKRTKGDYMKQHEIYDLNEKPCKEKDCK